MFHYWAISTKFQRLYGPYGDKGFIPEFGLLSYVVATIGILVPVRVNDSAILESVNAFQDVPVFEEQSFNQRREVFGSLIVHLSNRRNGVFDNDYGWCIDADNLEISIWLSSETYSWNTLQRMCREKEALRVNGWLSSMKCGCLDSVTFITSYVVGTICP